MRLYRVLVTWLLVAGVVAGSMGSPRMLSAATGAPGGDDERTPSQQASPGELTGSVVLRDPGGVSAASVDFEAYAASRYIVTYADSVTDVVKTTDRLAALLGFSPTHIYTARLRGFAAQLDRSQAERLRQRAEIAAIETDDVIPAPRAYGMPTGVERIGTLANSTARINGRDERVNVDVAVVDSGVDFSHPDLNVTNWADCTSANGDGWDQIGHGTHVAGTIGALDNGVGVTGVAPGARIWSIKIFTAQSGLESWAICGVELLADYGASIEVANLSWGWRQNGADTSCSQLAIHRAICDAYNAGVTLVNAAGNERVNAANSIPTTFSQVIAVSAMVDTDGKIGGKGPSTAYGCDDCFASFSNFGADIDLAAPGVNILSTCPTYLACNAGFGLARQTGTSMAAPHVAGAAALYIAKNGRVGPAKVRSALIANSDRVSLPGDPDGSHERVLYVGNLNPACSLSAVAGSPGATTTLSCTNFRAGETITVTWNSSGGTALGSFIASARGHGSVALTIPNAPKGTHAVIAKGRTSGRSVSASYRIAPTMSLTPNSGPAGTTVTVRLAGFGKGETVTVRLDPGTSSARTLKSGVAVASNGSKSVTVVIPAATVIGKHKIEVTGSAGSKVSRTFTVKVGASSVGAAESTASPTPTATATMPAPPTPTETATVPATAEPTATETAVPTLEPSPTPSPTESPTPEPTATEAPPEPTVSPAEETVSP